MPPSNYFPPVGVYRFGFTALEPVLLPQYPGSAWRGLLGHGLKRTVCVTRAPTCNGCMLAHSCLYSRLFESPPADSATRKRFTAVPHPFVLVIEGTRTPVSKAPGADFNLGINLYGDANSALPYLIHAMNTAGERGIGKGKGRFRVASVHQAQLRTPMEWSPIYRQGGSLTQAIPRDRPGPLPAAPECLRIELLTPLRIKHRGHYLGAAEFRFRDFVRPLLWRLGALAAFYGDGDPGFDAPALVRKAESVQLSGKELHWFDWTRYSSRQDTTMQMGGLVGSFSIPAGDLADLWYWLWLGQWTHVGKATSMGLGQYRIRRGDQDSPE